MIRILFVCHGNICRSPMAEFMMKEYVRRAGRENDFIIESAATSSEELGNDMYPPAKQILREKGIPFARRAARKITANDYSRFDMIICMDEYNLRNLQRFYNGDPEGKAAMLLNRPISDPLYTDDFESTYKDLQEGCERLIKQL